MNKKLGLIATAVGILALSAGAVQAQEKVKIGFVTDPNGAYIEVTQGLKELNDK